MVRAENSVWPGKSVRSGKAEGDNAGKALRPWWSWLVVLLISAWLLRTLHGFGGAGAHDLRGYGSDLAMAWLWLVLGAWAFRRLLLGLLAALIWTAIQVAGYEHLTALGALPRLSNIHYLWDPTFFRGSVVPTLLAPATLGMLGLTAAAAWIAYRMNRGRLTSAGWTPWFVATVLAIGFGLWPISERAPSWRQANALELGLRELGGALSGATGASRSKVDPRIGAELPPDDTGSDLSGRLLLPRAEGKNVLLILVESLGGGAFPSLLEVQGIDEPGLLPQTDALFRRGWMYSSFFSLQRQTQRGTYALLCGRAPRLAGGLSKMTELIKQRGEEVLDCLPEHLRRAGYQTAYLQAAHLPFSLKDQFMPKAGFERIFGERWFTDAHIWGKWGVDDKTFFEGALQTVEQMDAEPRPYFLTLLNVGTHHPYAVPEEYESTHEKHSFAWSMSYLDGQLVEFLARLKDRGLLDDTVVLLTSDEAVGLDRGQGDAAQMVDQAWGFLGVLTPDGSSGWVTEPYAQSDLPLSVLDLLGLVSDLPDEEDSLPFSGRSVFRQYSAPRTLAFGNVFLNRIAGVGPDGRLYGCKVDASECSKWRVPEGKLFADQRAEEDIGDGELGFLFRHVKSSDRLHRSDPKQGFGPRSKGARPIAYAFGLARFKTISSSDAFLEERSWVFDGQRYTVPPRSLVEVDVEVTLKGTLKDAVRIRQELMVADGPILYGEEASLTSGQSVRFHAVYRVGEEPLRRFECRFGVLDHGQGSWQMTFERAQLRITPLVGEQAIGPANGALVSGSSSIRGGD